MNSRKLLSLAAIAATVLLLLQPAAAATLRDVFGAFASMGEEKPEYDFDGSGGKITFGDVITALLGVFGLGGGAAACSKVADCPETTYGSTYCDGNNLVHDATEYACLNPGTPSSRCHASTKILLQKACPNGCADGNCLTQTHEGSGYFGTCCDGVDNDRDGAEDGLDADCSDEFSNFPLSDGYNSVCWGSDWNPYSFSGVYWSGAYNCPTGEVVSDIEYEIYLNPCSPDVAQCSYFHLMNSSFGWLDFTNSCGEADSEDYGFCRGAVSSNLLETTNSVRFSFNTADCGCGTDRGVRVHGITCTTPATQCTAYETSCADFEDNDCDGKFDCDDEDCKGSDDCRRYATTNDARFPVKGGITTAYMEINGCIEIIEEITVTGVLPPLQPTTLATTYLSTQADDNCINWPLDGDTIYLKNLSGQTLDVYNASVSLGPGHFDDYTMGACAFWGHFSSEKCPDSNSGGKGGFTESFGVTSINSVPGSGQECNINASISAGQEIRVGVSEFSYCANRLPPECECSTDELLHTHKDNPITITLNTSIGELNIYLYNFPI